MMAVFSSFFMKMTALIVLPTAVRGAVPLAFRQEPMDTIVVPGSYVVLPCGVNVQSLPLTYEWLRNGLTRLPSGASLSGNGSLTVRVPRSGDLGSFENYEGFYHCSVSTRRNRLRSRDASLRVHRPTSNGTLPEGTVVYFNTEISSVTREGYFDPLQPIWKILCFGSGKEALCPSTDCNLPHSLYPLESQKSQSVLIFSLRLLQQSTESTCVKYTLKSAWTKDDQKEFHISFEAIVSSPRLVVSPVSSAAELGGNVTMPCLANEAISYSWTKDGQSVDVVNDHRVTLSNGSLHITELNKTDEGQYVCTANIPNNMARSSSPATLKLYAHLGVQIVVSRSNSSGHVSVACHVSGSSPITVEFLRDGSLLLEKNVTTTQTVVLTHEMPVVVGNIVQCVASNNEGSKQTSHYIDSVPTDPPNANTTRTTAVIMSTTFPGHGIRSTPTTTPIPILTSRSVTRLSSSPYSSSSPSSFASLLVSTIPATVVPTLVLPFRPSPVPPSDRTTSSLDLESMQFGDLRRDGLHTAVAASCLIVVTIVFLTAVVLFRKRGVSSYSIEERQRRKSNPRLSQVWEEDVRNVEIPLPQLISHTPIYDTVAPDEIAAVQPSIALARISTNSDIDTSYIQMTDTSTTQGSRENEKLPPQDDEEIYENPTVQSLDASPGEKAQGLGHSYGNVTFNAVGYDTVC